MSKQREALELALEALQFAVYGEPVPSLEVAAMRAVRKALADPVQEAAPDLLNALEQLVAVKDYSDRIWGATFDWDAARAAIRKAKGEA